MSFENREYLGPAKPVNEAKGVIFRPMESVSKSSSLGELTFAEGRNPELHASLLIQGTALYTLRKGEIEVTSWPLIGGLSTKKMIKGEPLSFAAGDIFVLKGTGVVYVENFPPVEPGRTYDVVPLLPKRRS